MTEKERKGNEMWFSETEGETIQGEIINIDKNADYGTSYTLKAGEEIKRLPQHKVLQNRLEGTKIGDTVKVIYVGEEPPTKKGNNPTKMYRVFDITE